MSFLAMQTTIAKICVDYAFRQSFLRDPHEALACCDLTADECETVKAIDLKAIEEYADSLVGKKMALVTKWFPLSMTALRKGLPGRQLRQIVFNYGYHGTRDDSQLGGDWVRGEFLRFKSYLLDLVSQGEIQVPFFTDVLEFEATRQMLLQDPAASRSREEPVPEEVVARVFRDEAKSGVTPLLGKHVTIRRFNCDIVALIARTESEDNSDTAVAATPVWAMFVKKPGSGKVVVQTISPPLRDVLDLCDGTVTIREIVAAIVSRHAAPEGPTDEEVTDDCLAVLQQFYTAGLITA